MWGFHQPCYGLVVHLICIEFILGMEKNKGKPAFFFKALFKHVGNTTKSSGSKHIYFSLIFHMKLVIWGMLSINFWKDDAVFFQQWLHVFFFSVTFEWTSTIYR